jgi:Fibronectin type III domain
MRFTAASMTVALSLAACVQESPQVFSGTATLSWDAVKTDTRNKALTSLGGYKIYYGTSDRAMWYTIKVPKDQTTYVVKDLAPGTWYFAVSAYTTGGIEGARSSVASKTIQ